MCLLLSGKDISQLFSDWQKIIAIGCASVGLSLLLDLIPKSFKEILIFWRIRFRLPSHRAFANGRKFSEILDRNEVVDIAMRSSLGPKYQNRTFYRIYDKFRDVGSVRHYSTRYLQWRELASLSIFLIIIGYIYVGSEGGWASTQAALSLAIGIAITLCSILAARNSSEMLIDYVLLSEAVAKDDGK
ncbi:hypothetical protein [Croceicoccus mobilis]|uniref:hypothetical protein n=1 Tax=Croceicoccus mobilis TaxID=1703339 RepID=UPI00156159DA|nr:hypothetical protein [Croceicoccus mobilis]